MSLPVEQWPRVKELFAAAVELPADERAALLDRACEGDSTLRKEVESLLDSDEQAEGFIEKSAFALPGDLLAEEAEEEFAGRQFGAYRVVREIGRGGLGAVYLAARSDEQYQKQVAIKLVKRGLDTDDILRRFRAERQILAQLDHPNIARLIDAGSTEEGLPYFVMEFVDGQSIGSYCEAHQLPASSRLKLFRIVCGAVTYAHQHLVIHRDIKPSNVLVTEEGVPKLVDFGIAKVLHADDPTAAQTMTGIRVMTPEYASPEQVRGLAITTSTDVYSLGVLLYELLTGQKPYRLATRTAEEISRAVTDQIPERPSTAIDRAGISPQSAIRDPKSLRGDLDNIVLMALRKEPERRYASVEQFSEDIRRHIAGLPVVAHKATLSYRARKFVTRHRAGVLAAALIIATLCLGIATTWREKRRAERRFNDVRQLSNALLTDIAPKIERLQGSTEARQSVLAQSLKYLDSLAKESAGDPVLQSDLAAAYEKVGDLQGNPTNPNLIALADALKSYEKAHAIRQELITSDPRNAEQRRLLADNYRVLGDIRWQTNEQAESLRNSEAALRLYTELLAENPASTELRLAWIRTNHDIGKTLSSNEKYAESIGYFQKAIETAEELRQQSPDRTDVLMLLGNCRRQLANSLAWEGKQPEAEAEMAKALAIYEPLAAANRDDILVRTGLYQTYMLTSSLYEEVNDSLATEYGLKALRIVSENVEQDSANVRARQQLAKTYSRLGVTLDNEGKNAESIVHLEKAVAILQELAQKETKNRRFTHDLATAFIRLGDSRHKQREFPLALADFDKAATILLELANSDEADNASRRNLANAYDSAMKTHEELIAAPAGAEAQTHRSKARQYAQWALDALRQLESRNALSKYDQKSLEELQVALQKYD